MPLGTSIENVGEYYFSHYLESTFANDTKERWRRIGTLSSRSLISVTSSTDNASRRAAGVGGGDGRAVASSRRPHPPEQGVPNEKPVSSCDNYATHAENSVRPGSFSIRSRWIRYPASTILKLLC